jgi:hypothetical protein
VTRLVGGPGRSSMARRVSTRSKMGGRGSEEVVWR